MLPMPKKPVYIYSRSFSDAEMEMFHSTSPKPTSLPPAGWRLLDEADWRQLDHPSRPCRKPVRSVTEPPSTVLAPPGNTIPEPHRPGWASSTYSILEALDQATSALTILEVATLFQVSDKTIRRMVTRREIPSILIGGHRRFDPRTLRWWVTKRSPEMARAAGF